MSIRKGEKKEEKKKKGRGKSEFGVPVLISFFLDWRPESLPKQRRKRKKKKEEGKGKKKKEGERKTPSVYICCTWSFSLKTRPKKSEEGAKGEGAKKRERKKKGGKEKTERVDVLLFVRGRHRGKSLKRVGKKKKEGCFRGWTYYSYRP